MEEAIERDLTGSPAFQQLIQDMTFVLFSNQQPVGTGFFVASDLAVTARHNFPSVAPGDEVKADWFGETRFRVCELAWETLSSKDLMLLEPIDCSTLTSGYLCPEAYLKDDCYIYGHMRNRPKPEGVLVQVEDSLGDKIRVKSGHIERGLSGAAAVNLRTGGVCGVVVSSRDTNADRGGYIISSALLTAIDRVQQASRECIAEDGRWLRYATRPVQGFSVERRLTVRVSNHLNRPDLIQTAVECISERYSAGRSTTVVLRGPSGYGKTTLADDIVDKLEQQLALNFTRLRCLASPQPPQTGARAVLVDGLNDLSAVATVKRNWLERLLCAHVRIITTSAAQDINLIRMVFQSAQQHDLAAMKVIEVQPLTLEQTFGIVDRTSLPCQNSPSELAQTIYDVSGGIPFLVQLALDLVCTGDFDALPKLEGVPNENRKALYDAWRSTWLASRPHCEKVANYLCIGSTIGLSEEALIYVFERLNHEVDTREAIRELAAKGYITKADLIDNTWIPHRLLRDAYTDLTFAKGAEALHLALAEYADSKVIETTGRIRDLLTIIDIWARGITRQFEQVAAGKPLDMANSLPPYVQFSNDLIGRLAKRSGGITTEEWQRWLAGYIQQHIASMGCSRKIALARAVLRLNCATPFLGEAFLGGWCLEYAPLPLEDVDSAGEAYALIASAFSWESGDAEIQARGLTRLRADIEKRRPGTPRELDYPRRMAFLSAFTRLGDLAAARRVLNLSPADDTAHLVTCFVLLLLSQGKESDARELLRRHSPMRHCDPIAALFLKHSGMPIHGPYGDRLKYQPNQIAFLAFCSNSHALEDALQRVLLRSEPESPDGLIWKVSRADALAAMERLTPD
jgi:hypothetical protein